MSHHVLQCVEQTRPFMCVVRTSSAKFCLYDGNVKFTAQNEGVSISIINCVCGISPVHISAHHAP